MHKTEIMYVSGRSVYEQYHLGSSINFAMHKIKHDTIRAGTVKNNSKGMIERFVACENVFSFISRVNGTPSD